MSFLRIPESDVAFIMSVLLGKAIGFIISTAQKKLLEIKAKILEKLASKVKSAIASKKEQINKVIDKANSTLSSIESQISNVTALLNSISKLILAIKIPLTALRILVKVLKALPLPQKYLVVSVTVLYSDLLEKTLELIKQIDDLCTALLAISATLPIPLNMVQNIIANIKVWLAALRIDDELSEVSEEDKAILESAGLVDSKTGETITSKLGAAAGGSVSASGGSSSSGASSAPVSIAFGDCSEASTSEEAKKLQKVTKTVEFKNKLANAKPGDTIKQIVDSTGDCKVVLYSVEGTDTSKLNSSNIPDGWSESPIQGNSNIKAVATLSGITGKVKGNWTITTISTEEVALELENQNSSHAVGSVNSKNSKEFIDLYFDTVTIPVLDSTNLANLRNKTGILKVDSVEQLLGQVASTLNTLPLSKELKGKLDRYAESLVFEQNAVSDKKERKRLFDY